MRCEVEQQYADRVAPGQCCDIYNDELGRPQWTGVVKRCAGLITDRTQFSNNPSEINDTRTMLCTVLVDRLEPPLRVGQRVRVVFRAKP